MSFIRKLLFKRTPPSKLNMSQNRLYPVGRIRVVLTQNIGRRYFADNLRGREMYYAFREARGTAQLARAIRNLQVHNSDFRRQDNIIENNASTDVLIEEIGYELNVLNQYLLEYEFMPIYELTADGNRRILNEDRNLNAEMGSTLRVQFDTVAEKLLDNPAYYAYRQTVDAALRQEWGRWPKKKIMLSKYGLFQVLLEREVTGNEELVNILESVSALQQEFDLDVLRGEKQPETAGDDLNRLLDPSVQWEIVRILIGRFIEAFGRQILLISREGAATRLDFNATQARARAAFTKGVSYPQRFRYVIFEFSNFSRTPDSHDTPLYPAQLSDHDRGGLAQLLTGVSVATGGHISRQPPLPGGQRWLIPAPVKPEWAASIFRHDLSTFERELSLFFADSALVYSGHIDKVTLGLPSSPVPGAPLPFGTRVINYGDYWRSIIRGITYVCELQTIARVLQGSTSDDLEKITQLERPLHRRKIAAANFTMENYMKRLAVSSRLVARLRTANRPTTIGTSEYAVSKFRKLVEVLEVEKTIEQANLNIQLINEFFESYDDAVMQLRASVTGNLTLGLTFVLAVITAVLPVLALAPYLDLISHESLSLPPFIDRTILQLGGWIVTMLAIAIGFGGIFFNLHRVVGIIRDSHALRSVKRYWKHITLKWYYPSVFRIFDVRWWAFDDTVDELPSEEDIKAVVIVALCDGVPVLVVPVAKTEEVDPGRISANTASPVLEIIENEAYYDAVDRILGQNEETPPNFISYVVPVATWTIRRSFLSLITDWLRDRIYAFLFWSTRHWFSTLQRSRSVVVAGYVEVQFREGPFATDVPIAARVAEAVFIGPTGSSTCAMPLGRKELQQLCTYAQRCREENLGRT